jgi:hypothetical protein
MVQDDGSAGQSTSIFRDMTRATKFQKKFQLPPDFSEVLKDFTREVLRDQPGDIYAYAANYFKRMALEAEGLEEVPAPEGASARAEMSPEQRQEVSDLRTRLLDAFSEEDFDKTAKLHCYVVKRVLTSTCNLSPDQALYLVSNCQNNLQTVDGSLDYEQFVLDNAKYVHFFMTTNYVFQNDKADADTVHGLTSEELSTQLMHLLQSNDESKTGRLYLETYHDCLRRAPLQLTHRDITLLTAEAVVSGDNYINIADETTRAFPLLQASAVFEVFQQAWNEGSI